MEIRIPKLSTILRRFDLPDKSTNKTKSKSRNSKNKLTNTDDGWFGKMDLTGMIASFIMLLVIIFIGSSILTTLPDLIQVDPAQNITMINSSSNFIETFTEYSGSFGPNIFSTMLFFSKIIFWLAIGVIIHRLYRLSKELTDYSL